MYRAVEHGRFTQHQQPGANLTCSLARLAPGGWGETVDGRVEYAALTAYNVVHLI
jgi:hypothetical protein